MISLLDSSKILDEHWQDIVATMPPVSSERLVAQEHLRFELERIIALSNRSLTAEEYRDFSLGPANDLEALSGVIEILDNGDYNHVIGIEEVEEARRILQKLAEGPYWVMQHHEKKALEAPKKNEKRFEHKIVLKAADQWALCYYPESFTISESDSPQMLFLEKCLEVAGMNVNRRTIVNWINAYKCC